MRKLKSAMRALFLFLLLSSSSGLLAAQVTRTPNESVYLELGGNSGVYSINVDVALPGGLGFRVGCLRATETRYTEILGRPSYYSDEKGVSFLMMINYLKGEGNHHVEAGAGVLAGPLGFSDPSTTRRSPAITITLGYRYQRPSGGLVFRTGFTPAWSGGSVHPMMGVSLGFALDSLLK